jgi:L-ascorbate metabolism protein UlaG (beta-lactamase superfamily)
LPLDRMRALGRLLPLIRKGLFEGEIRQELQERLAREESQWAVDVLLSLKATGWLTSTPKSSNVFLRPSKRPRVVFMGHSSLLFQSEQSAVLVDPIVRPNFRLPRYAFDVTRIKLSAICCTHSHWDHCDLQTLLWFDKDTPIYIPAVKHPSAFNPPIKPALSLLGFTDIREVNPWEHHQIDDIEFIPAPFHGEQDEPDADIDHYTFVLRATGATIYGGVDAFRDWRGQMKPVLEKIRELYHPTVAFLPVSKMIYRYRTGGVNGFCRYLDTSLLNQSFQYTAAAEDAAEWMMELKCKWVVPYATFTFSPWSTPREVSEFARALRSIGLTDALFPLRALDSLALSSGANTWSARSRRVLLAAWFRLGAVTRRFDRRLQKNRAYGLFRKAVRYLSKTHA